MLVTESYRNVERTGRRKLTRLSTVARRVSGVRHFDLDLYQTCERCKYPQLFAEVKSREVSDAEWAVTRMHARHYGYGCVAILVVETPDRIGVKEYFSSTNLITPHVIYGDEDDLQRVLEHARDIHHCA
jgi:hypothetical protein